MKKTLLLTVFSLLGCIQFLNAATRTWKGAGAGGSGTDFNTASNWAEGQVPGSGDDVVINITSFTNSLINISNSLTVKSVSINVTAATVVNPSAALNFTVSSSLIISGDLTITNNAVSLASIFSLYVNVSSGSTLAVSGNVTATNKAASVKNIVAFQNSGTMTVTGTVTANSENTTAASTTSFLAAANTAVYNFNGNVILDNGSSTSSNGIILGATSSSVTGKFVFKGNLTIGAAAKTGTDFTGCTASFEAGTGTTQTITYNNTSAFNLPNVVVGNSTYPNIVLAGTSTNTDITGDLTINGTSVVDINTRQWNRATTGGSFRMNATSKLRLSGTSSRLNGGTAVIDGSNFPSRFTTNTMELVNNFPTIEYYGTNQTLASTFTSFGDILITSTGGNIYGATGTVTFAGNFTKPAAVTFQHNNGTLNFTSINNKNMYLNDDVTEFYNLTLAGSSPTMNNNFTIINNLSIGTYINLSKTVTLKSTAAATASVIFTNGTTSIGGNPPFIVERYISSGRKWRFLSFPTQDQNASFKSTWQEGGASGSNPVPGYGMQITDNNSTNLTGRGFDALSAYGPSVKYWNGMGYTGIANTTAGFNQLSTGNPGLTWNSFMSFMCFIRGDRTASPSNSTVTTTTLRTKGTLYIGNQTISIPSNTLYTAVGNPYAAAIDLRLITYSGVAANAFYVWDPKLTGTYGLGGFQTITLNGSNYTVSPGGGSYGASGSINNFIQSGSAFFVKGSGSGGSILFKETSKDAGSSLVMRAQGDALPVVRMNLYLKSGTDTELVDGASAIIDNSFSNNVDSDDATKLVNTSENVSIRKSDSLLAVERRKIFTANDTIFLNLTGVRASDYQWKLYMDDIELQGCTPFMIDKFTNTATPLSLSDTNVISFSIQNIAGSYAADRFMIVFKPSAVVPVRFVSVSAVRSSNDKSVNVKWSIENELNISSYNIEYSIDGRTFVGAGTQVAANVNTYSFNHANAPAGTVYYRIKAQEMDSRFFYSPVLKVAGSAEISGITVYPNPVENKQMNVAFIKQQAGSYSIRLINAEGQVVYSSTLKLAGQNETHSFQIGNVATGTYQLSIIGNDQSMRTQSIIVR